MSKTYAPMITKKAAIPSGKQASFERNRNLFYVCCSRPKRRLFFFVTVPIDSVFNSFLAELVGEQNLKMWKSGSFAETWAWSFKQLQLTD